MPSRDPSHCKRPTERSAFRSEIREYADMERLDETAGRVNGTYGEASWTPIRYVNRTHSRTALVGLYRSLAPRLSLRCVMG